MGGRTQYVVEVLMDDHLYAGEDYRRYLIARSELEKLLVLNPRGSLVDPFVVLGHLRWFRKSYRRGMENRLKVEPLAKSGKLWDVRKYLPKIIREFVLIEGKIRNDRTDHAVDPYLELLERLTGLREPKINKEDLST